jgi:hypothetical protein
MADADIPTETANRFETVKLSTPIVRGELTIATLILRKPRAGELRNLSMRDILTSDVTALLTLIPRVSAPPLTSHEVDELEADDFTEITGAIRGFFMTKAEISAVEALIAEHQPKT